jgi:hypothetical protein
VTPAITAIPAVARYRIASVSQIGCLFRFLVASLLARHYLTRRSFRETVAMVRLRKVRHINRPFNMPQARRLCTTFDSMRLFFPSAYLCLFDSLALINFLALYRLYPDWVFGVATDPFQAHCWVQKNGIVLNDTVERISNYLPIMDV